MVNWNCAPGGTAPDRFEVMLVSAGPSVVVVHCAELLPLAAACSLGPLMVTLFVSGTFSPTLTSTVVVSAIVPPLGAAAKPAGKTQVRTWPLTLVGAGEAFSGVLVKLRP